MAEWRDMTRIPRGMSDFQRWFRPNLPNKYVAPSDVDGILHTKNGNRFLMMEFKPVNVDVTVGQDITLKGFSQLPNCTSMCIFDPYASDSTRAKYGDELVLDFYVYKDGKRTKHLFTVAEFNTQIELWFKNAGAFV